MAIVMRWYRILELLVAHGSVGVEELRRELHVSLSTLHKSLEQLNEILDSDITIRQADNRIYMDVYDYARLEEILSGSLRKESDFNSASKRSAYLIKRLVQSDHPVLIDDLAEELGVSRTTVNKDLKQVKELAEEYRIVLSGRPNRGLEIEGSELQLRLFYLHQVYAYFEATSLLGETMVFLEELKTRYKLPRKTLDLLTKAMSVTVARLRRGCQLEGNIPYFANELAQSDIVAQIVYHMEMTYSLSLSQYEQDFLSFPLNTQYIHGLDYKSQQGKELQAMYLAIIRRVQESLSVKFDADRLYVELHNHLKFLLNRLIFHVQTNDIFHGEIRHKYPLAFEMARVASEALKDYFHNGLELSEVSYLALYFEMSLRVEEEQELTQRKVAVVCTTGRGTANMICRQLSRVLGQDIEITQYSEEQFNPLQDDDYFAIFTTIPLKLGGLKSPVIHLTNLFDDQWLRNEWQKVHRHHQKNLEHLLLRFTRLPVLADYPAYLSYMAEQLMQQGLVDKEFAQRIGEREERQSTVFGNGIGFPHTINQLDTETVLSIGVLEEACQTDTGETVELIFLVAIPKAVEDKMAAELLEAYDDIFRIAGDEELKTGLRQLATEADFLDFIREKGVF